MLIWCDIVLLDFALVCFTGFPQHMVESVSVYSCCLLWNHSSNVLLWNSFARIFLLWRSERAWLGISLCQTCDTILTMGLFLAFVVPVPALGCLLPVDWRNWIMTSNTWMSHAVPSTLLLPPFLYTRSQTQITDIKVKINACWSQCYKIACHIVYRVN